MNGKDLNSIRELLSQYKDHSDEWRTSTDKKFDKIFEWLERLPCSESIEKHKTTKEQLIALWGIVSAVTVGFIGWILHK